MISVSCSGCRKAYRLEDRFAGKTVRCKACGQSFIAPNPDVDLDEIFPSMEDEKPAPAPKKTSTIDQRSRTPSQQESLTPQPPAQSSTLATDFEIREPEQFEIDLGSDSDQGHDDADPNADYGAFESEGVTIGKSHVPRMKVKKTRAKKSPDVRSRVLAITTHEPGKTIVWGSMAGFLGAICWGAIAYYANREISYVAWAIGWIVGSAVRLTSDEIDDRTAGFIAACIAIASIVCGKLFAAIAIELDEGTANFDWSLVGQGFLATFGFLDLLFFVFAICTAYYVASRSTGD